jgi:hypothetical protein
MEGATILIAVGASPYAIKGGRNSFSPPPSIAFGASFALCIWHIRPLRRKSLVDMAFHVSSLFARSLDLSLRVDLLQSIRHMLRPKRRLDISPGTRFASIVGEVDFTHAAQIPTNR